MTATLWLDVEDLFEYARSNPRPSGIQRLAFELYQALHAEYGDTGLVRFVRHDPPRNSFRDVRWSEIVSSFRKLTEATPGQQSVIASAGIVPHSPSRQVVRRMVYRLSPELRQHVTEALVAEESAMRAWGRLLLAVGRTARQKAKRPARIAATETGSNCIRTDGGAAAGYAVCAKRGDVLLALGAPWSHADYASLIRSQQEKRGLRFSLLVYDLVPLRRPEWCESGLVRLFHAWYETVLPLCEQVFAISQATAADVEAYAREHAQTLPRPVVPIPLGTGYSNASLPHRSERLPSVGSYALIVSTIEARKNHQLLFRVWRQLLQDLPRERVPTLVFAGRIGWLVGDLMRQIANTNHLAGKLVIIENPSDGELAALYQGCQFTLFPSFYEGWGLPVTESLSFGKPCLIADHSALLEAGGGLERQFDPDNLRDAYAKIRRVIDDPEDLARWTAAVRRDFRAVPWSASVESLLAGLGHCLGAAKTAGDPEIVERSVSTDAGVVNMIDTKGSACVARLAS